MRSLTSVAAHNISSSNTINNTKNQAVQNAEVEKRGHCESKLQFLLIAAMPCVRSGALLAATVACPWESLRIVPGE